MSLNHGKKNNMKNILIVDADSKIPNIALMKIFSYHKKNGDHVTFQRLNISFHYRKRRKNKIFVPSNLFDKTYVSTIFEGTLDFIEFADKNVEIGGTGYDIKKKLPVKQDKIYRTTNVCI